MRFIKEELAKLQEPGSHIGEVVKLMGRKKALVKVRALSIATFLSFSSF